MLIIRNNLVSDPGYLDSCFRRNDDGMAKTGAVAAVAATEPTIGTGTAKCLWEESIVNDTSDCMISFKSSPAIRYSIRHALPVLAALWLVWTGLELKRMQGWYEGQDDALHRATASFHFPAVELSVPCAVIIASVLLTTVGLSRLAIGLAFAGLLITELLWIAQTR